MKEIQLTQGKVALVDDEDYDYLNQWKWFANLQNGKFYARRNIPKISGKRGSLLMHRLILNMLNPKMQVDHLNHFTLDNRKCNLRICTDAENKRNREMNKNNLSGYKGISFDKRVNKYHSSISINKKRFFLGSYIDPIDAARAYNEAALKYHGEFAHINKID